VIRAVVFDVGGTLDNESLEYGRGRTGWAFRGTRSRRSSALSPPRAGTTGRRSRVSGRAHFFTNPRADDAGTPCFRLSLSADEAVIAEGVDRIAETLGELRHKAGRRTDS
jgi:hypothetical protein